MRNARDDDVHHEEGEGRRDCRPDQAVRRDEREVGDDVDDERERVTDEEVRRHAERGQRLAVAPSKALTKKPTERMTSAGAPSV